MDQDTKLLLAVVVVAGLCVAILYYEVCIVMPGEMEYAENTMIEVTGLDIQKVTINSPTFYVEFEEMSGFLGAVTENEATIIYTDGLNYGTFYVVFNEDYSIGYRIYASSLITHEKRSTP